MTEKIKQPWVVYSYATPIWIGKVIKEKENCLFIQYSETQEYPPHLWDSKSVKRFDNPLEAIEYFLVQSHELSKKTIISRFLADFPSEKNNLEKLLAQSQPNCIEFSPSKSKRIKKLERIEDSGSPNDYA